MKLCATPNCERATREDFRWCDDCTAVVLRSLAGQADGEGNAGRGMRLTCTRCGRPATTNVYGTFRNGRLAIDRRCDGHKPSEAERGTWLLKFSDRRPFNAKEYRYTGSGPIETSA